MINIYLQLGLYYFAVIVGIFLHRYFSQFIASDFQNNHSLKVKRRWGVAYFYGVGIWSIHVIHLMGSNSHRFEENLFNLSIIPSVFLIILWHCYIIVALESPKKSHKKQKWK